jgi:NADH:ubiquinone oxidoreductase subunit F (NADH-binding)
LEDEKLSLKRENTALRDQIDDLKESPDQRPDLSLTTNLYGMPTEEEYN